MTNTVIDAVDEALDTLRRRRHTLAVHASEVERVQARVYDAGMSPQLVVKAVTFLEPGQAMLIPPAPDWLPVTLPAD